MREDRSVNPSVLIAAGGTAGHVVPALAVAERLTAAGADVIFVGGERAEAELVPAAGYELRTIRVAGLDRRNPLKALRAALLALRAMRRCVRLLRELRVARRFESFSREELAVRTVHLVLAPRA